jgi:hypothetical protein
VKLTDQHSYRIESVIEDALCKYPIMRQIHDDDCQGERSCECEVEWGRDSQAVRLCAQHILLELGKLEADIGDK